MWAEFVAITILVWLIEATVWFALVALIVRPLGIKLPILWWNTPESAAAVANALSRWQYAVVEGVLKYGVGSWVLLSTADYISNRFEDHPLSGDMTASVFFFGMVVSMLMGFLVGLADWARRRRQYFTSPN